MSFSKEANKPLKIETAMIEEMHCVGVIQKALRQPHSRRSNHPFGE
jgi:hypothetical protein